MLASTMQFSSNGRTHQAHHDHHYRQAGGYDHNLMTRTSIQKHPTLQDQPTRPTPQHLPKKTPHRHDTMTRSLGRLPQDPTVCSANPHPRPAAFQPARLPKETSTGVLAATRDQGLFVNVPPMSNHPRRVRPGPGLCHQHQPSPRRTCSVERPATPAMWGLVEMSSLERR